MHLYCCMAVRHYNGSIIMGYTIETNVPVRRKNASYPFATMQPGESVRIPAPTLRERQKVAKAAYAVQKRKGVSVKCAFEDDSVYVWLLA